MKNKLEDMRNHLFEQLERLGDASPDDMQAEIARAKAVSDVTGRLIESAKVEVDYIRAADELLGKGAVDEQSSRVIGSGFIPSEPRHPKSLGSES